MNKEELEPFQMQQETPIFDWGQKLPQKLQQQPSTTAKELQR